MGEPSGWQEKNAPRRWTREERERVVTLRASNPKKYGPTRIAKETGIPIAQIKFWLDAAAWRPRRKSPEADSRLKFQDWESWKGAALRMRFLKLAKDKRYPHHGEPPMRQELIAWVRVQVMTCVYCARALTTKNFSVDHALPVVRGGTSALGNLRPCCKHCNEVKESMTDVEYMALRALVSTWEDEGKKIFSRLRSGGLHSFRRPPITPPV